MAAKNVSNIGKVSGQAHKSANVTNKGVVHFQKDQEQFSMKPNSENPSNQQVKLKLMQLHLSFIQPFVKRGFKYYFPNFNPQNAALSYNLQYAIDDSETEPKILWEKFSFSQGPANPINSAALHISAEQQILSISWTLNPQLQIKEKMAEYKAMVLLFPDKPTKHPIIAEMYGNSPLSAQQLIPLGKSLKKIKYHVYIAFGPINDLTPCTSSKYLGSIDWKTE